MTEWSNREGSPSPLGLSFIEHAQAYNFALDSKHASGIVLLLYTFDDTSQPTLEHRLDPLLNKSGRIWHCRIAATLVDRASYYVYRVEGPFDLREGHRFASEKVLLDPYARQVFFPPGFSRRAAAAPGRNDGQAPLGVIRSCRERFDWTGDTRPRHGHDTVIYELHVRGFTKRENSGVSPGKRGTYAGVIEKIPYLKALGITAVELLPMHQRDPQEANYWGYMTLAFFAAERSYAVDPEHANEEFAAMVKALHEADIEVIIDVAFNHTTEADENGPTYSLRGIDNSTYYLLADDRRWYRNDTGCGNMLHTANMATRKLILDSLRFWLEEMHVDGFRFDLASIFSRDERGQVDLREPPMIAEISAEPAFSSARLIAEAWDLTSYQLGRRFPGLTWFQWNGRFRDDVRMFVKGEPDTLKAMITRLYGSDDLFPDTAADACHAYQSVNYITSHDGFNLHDLTAYETKRNEPNGLGNRDGTDVNHSWNCGWEGAVGAPPEVLELRKRQAKNFCALLMLSNGTPMFCAGDEFLHTQRGNNNPFNQDNETTWIDWDRRAENPDIWRFFREMIAFRKRHPSIGRSRHWRSDVQWYGVTGHLDPAPWAHALAFCLRGGSEGDADLYVMINAWEQDLLFRIQQPASGGWRVAIDTSCPSPEDIFEAGAMPTATGCDYLLRARSVAVLESVET